MDDFIRISKEKMHFDLTVAIINDIMEKLEVEKETKELSHHKIGNLKDIDYACFAHLSYFDWHKLHNFIEEKNKHNLELKLKNEAEIKKAKELVLSRISMTKIQLTDEITNLIEKTLKKRIEKKNRIYYKTLEILESKLLFSLIRNARYEKLFKDTPNYPKSKKIKHIEEGEVKEVEAKIYKTDDPSFFIHYSEDTSDPNENKKYPSLGEWEFVAGYDHKSIWDSLEYSNGEKAMAQFDSGFQSSVFKRENNIIIAYRGSDDMLKGEHFLSDWLYTNVSLGSGVLPNSITCAVWTYNKVVEDFPEAKIHITGHSMGGALAQYVGIYSDKEVKTVTWNGLGIGNDFKIVFDKLKREHYKVFKKNYREKNNQNLINYYINLDLTPNLQQRVGETKVADRNSEKTLDNNRSNVTKKAYEIGKTVLKVNEASDLHSVTNFLPFMTDMGNVRTGEPNSKFMSNILKTYISETDFEKSYEKEKVVKELDSIIRGIRKKESKIEGLSIFSYEPNKKEVKSNKFEKSFIKNLEKSVKPYIEEENYVKLGHFSNTENLAGIDCSNFLMIKLVEEEVQKECKEENGEENSKGQTTVVEDTTMATQEYIRMQGILSNKIVLGNTQIGSSANIREIDHNTWEENLGHIFLKYYYENCGNDLLIKWEKEETKEKKVKTGEIKIENYNYGDYQLIIPSYEKISAISKRTIPFEIAGEMSIEKYVLCKGATLSCNQGDATSIYEVLPQRGVFLDGKPLAAISDTKPMINIKPFGMCKSMANPTVAVATAANRGKLQKMPCVPNTIGIWTDGANHFLSSEKIPCESSKCKCAYAGEISIKDLGRSLLGISGGSSNGNNEESDEKNKEVSNEFKEINAVVAELRKSHKK